MAHFAKLNEENIVTEVIVVSNLDITDENGAESEQLGIAFCQMMHGPQTVWVQTSYNHNMRGVFAGIGMRYDAEQDQFIAPPADRVSSGATSPVNTRSFFEHL